MDFWQAVAGSLSVRQVLARIGLVPAGGNYKTMQQRINRLGLDISHFTGAGWSVGAVLNGRTAFLMGGISRIFDLYLP